MGSELKDLNQGVNLDDAKQRNDLMREHYVILVERQQVEYELAMTVADFNVEDATNPLSLQNAYLDLQIAERRTKNSLILLEKLMTLDRYKSGKLYQDGEVAWQLTQLVKEVKKFSQTFERQAREQISREDMRIDSEKRRIKKENKRIDMENERRDKEHNLKKADDSDSE